MAEPLAIKIFKNNKMISVLYFRHGAYTVKALKETQEYIFYLGDCKKLDEKAIQLKTIRYAEKKGGGVERPEFSSEYAFITEIFPNKNFESDREMRNGPLVAISEQGMFNLCKHLDGYIEIHLDKNIISNFCVDYYADLYDAIYQGRFDEDAKDMSVPVLGISDIIKIQFCSIVKVADTIEKATNRLKKSFFAATDEKGKFFVVLA